MDLRLTARLRLTLLLSALFLGAGGILLALNYTLVRYRLQFLPVPVVTAIDAGDGPLPHALPLPPPTEADRIILRAPPSPEEFATLSAVQEQVVAASLRELVLQSALALAVMAVLVIGLSWLVAGRVLRPVRAITAVAQRLSEERLHERIALAGPRDELKDLADTFDGMLGRLERAFAGQRRFAASASHELRTPLAIMRTEVDVTLADPQASVADLRAMGETVRDAVARSERLIDGLLALARSEQVIARREPGDLADCARAALRQVAAEAQARGVRCAAELAPAPVQGDTALLERLVANLLENAVRHNIPDGWVCVRTGTDGAVATLEIENSGLSLPDDRVEELFLPFRRLAGERVGTAQGAGLGLTIARATAEAHGGTLAAAARAEGGMRVTLRLPVAQL